MVAATSCPQARELAQLASGELASPQADVLLEHLEGCEKCLGVVLQQTSSDTLVDMVGKEKTKHDGADEAIVSRLIAGLSKMGQKPVSRGTADVQHLNLQCACGAKLKVKAELAGKKVKCPKCAQVVLAVAAVPGLSEEKTMAGEVDPRQVAEGKTIAPEADASDPKRHSASPEDTQVEARGEETEVWDFLAPAQQPDEIGRLGPYRILKVLGHGGMGVVFKAEDPHLERSVALKAMLPSLAASASAKKRFLREAKAAAALKHDNVVAIYQVGEDRGAPFLAMEFLAGESLDDRVKRDNILPVSEALRIGLQVAEGLAAAHDCGLIHRDIKPGNIWLEARKQVSGIRSQKAASADSPAADFRVKILDFGLARSMTDQTQLTQSGAIIGTPAYMAPEQATNAAVDHRCDLFSLGCVLYRLTTGELPFKGDNTLTILSALAMETPMLPVKLNTELPRELSTLIMSLLAKKPVDRPENAHAVADTLRGLLAQEERTGEMPAVKGRAQAKQTREASPRLAQKNSPVSRSRRPLVFAAAGMAAALLLVAGIVFYLPAGNGTIRVEIDDPETEVVLTKTGVKIKGVDKQRDIVVAPGDHMFKIKRGDLEFETDKFVLKKGETVTLKVEFLQGKLQAVADGKIIGEETAKLKPADPATQRRIAEWVLSKKGRVTVPFRGSLVEVASPDQLPKDPFTLIGVNLGMGGNYNAEGIFNDDMRQLAVLTNLESLNLQRQAITHEGLAHLTGCGELKELMLYESRVGAEAIPLIAKFTKLEACMLPSKQSDDWAAALAKMPTIREVNAYHSDIGDAGVAHLARLPKLEKLILDDTGNMTDASVKALESCKSLRTLALCPPGPVGKMTWEGIERLRKALPECDISPKK